MKLNVPEPVAAYFAAEEAKDAVKLSLCFADAGTVHDEGKDYRGRDAFDVGSGRRTTNTSMSYCRSALRRTGMK